MAEVRLSNINKSYGDQQVLFDVSITADDGEFVVFVGPSGCGKSTLLRSIAGLETISSGQIMLGGEDVSGVIPSQRGVAMVFQSYALYPHMTVQGNIAFGLEMAGLDKQARAERIEEAARILQLEDYLDRRPSQLSGGQRQRVAIGRAIVKQPKVFLFDEPLSNLDAALRIQMRVELENLHSALGSTMIYVTHDQVEAMTMADKIVVLNLGKVEQVGPPLELYHRPETKFVAGFIGAPSMNFLDGTVSGSDGNGATVSYSGTSLQADGFSGPKAGNSVTIGIRPEHLHFAELDAATLKARVGTVEALGAESFIHVTTEQGDPLVVRNPGDDTPARDTLIGLAPEPKRLHLFDETGGSLRQSG
ncbi:MAG: sn-glycerol-3-phosphate ABC transporter ATP-binding protein UgpC [Pseudomonadota bacterium]